LLFFKGFEKFEYALDSAKTPKEKNTQAVVPLAAAPRSPAFGIRLRIDRIEHEDAPSAEIYLRLGPV